MIQSLQGRRDFHATWKVLVAKNGFFIGLKWPHKSAAHSTKICGCNFFLDEFCWLLQRLRLSARSSTKLSDCQSRSTPMSFFARELWVTHLEQRAPIPYSSSVVAHLKSQRSIVRKRERSNMLLKERIIYCAISWKDQVKPLKCIVWQVGTDRRT